MSLPALVARLRAVVTDAAAVDGARSAAARQLARLAAAGVPGADPGDWYGLAGASVEGPLREPGAAVRVSPSKVESFDRCALRWLLQKVGGTAGSSRAQGLGTLIHEIAAAEPDADQQRLRQLLAERNRQPRAGQRVDRRLRASPRRGHDRQARRVRADRRREGRQLVAVEQGMQVELGEAVVRGQVDRLERDAEGRLVVVDLKTGKSAPTKAEAARKRAARGLPAGRRGGWVRRRRGWRAGQRGSGARPARHEHGDAVRPAAARAGRRRRPGLGTPAGAAGRGGDGGRGLPGDDERDVRAVRAAAVRARFRSRAGRWGM
jgi:hypothetical protein